MLEHVLDPHVHQRLPRRSALPHELRAHEQQLDGPRARGGREEDVRAPRPRPSELGRLQLGRAQDEPRRRALGRGAARRELARALERRARAGCARGVEAGASAEEGAGARRRDELRMVEWRGAGPAGG